ncbi:helix-turn-helix domain-containing protein, partial [Sorangium cellulosum]|uniref:helix-turn-helix domain-containing protein n=1 Tax=Sorangium cellulosum TaxID=56 RepID=UPI001F2BD54D
MAQVPRAGRGAEPAVRFNHTLLQRARLELDLTQEQVAASIGVDVRTYRRYESGAVNDPRLGFSVRSPSRRRILERLSAELGIAEAELLVGEAGGAPAELPAAAAQAPAAAAQAPRPGGVLVWSFYDDPRTEAFLDQAAAYFAPGAGGSGTPAPPAPAAPGEQLARLRAALGQGPPHLLVLDGLETVQADGSAGRAHGELHDALLRRLLCAIAAGLGGARALVTSRFELADLAAWADGGLAAIRPASLSPDDAASLLRRWGIRGDDGALRALLDRTGGHALSVAVVGSYVGAFLGGDAGRLAAAHAAQLAEAERDDPLARRLSSVLSAYARALPPGERDLLARLSVFPGGAGEAALLQLARAGGEIAGAMAGWGAAELARGLARLERLGLVFAARQGEVFYSTHPFVRQHFKALLGVPPERVHAAGSAAPPPRLDEAHNEVAEALADPAPLATGLRTLAYTRRLRG